MVNPQYQIIRQFSYTIGRFLDEKNRKRLTSGPSFADSSFLLSLFAADRFFRFQLFADSIGSWSRFSTGREISDGFKYASLLGIQI
jgi:hypothetical protein